MKPIETVIVGGGQAGLATSYYLNQQGKKHIVLEQAGKAAHGWRNRSWDSFTLVTPNWSFRIPGGEELLTTDRDGYLPLATVIDFFERYVNHYKLPVQYNSTVECVELTDQHKYRIKTSSQTFEAKNVIMATGFYQQPNIPVFGKNISPAVTQLHSSAYRNPASVQKGAVLVIGSGQSGCQVAEELNLAGKKVFLSTGKAGRAPRRYRGKDIIEWLELAGFFNLTPEQLPPGIGRFGSIPHVSGTKGGHTINLHQFAKEGITLLGRITGADKNSLSLAPDLHMNLTIADQFEANATNMIDGFIQSTGMDAPPETLPQFREGFDQPVIETLNLEKENINTIIWANGFRFDYSLVKIPAFDKDGFPVQQQGVTKYPGLYFAGMPWMPSERSGFLLGMAENAKLIADKISKK